MLEEPNSYALTGNKVPSEVIPQDENSMVAQFAQDESSEPAECGDEKRASLQLLARHRTGCPLILPRPMPAIIFLV